MSMCLCVLSKFGYKEMKIVYRIILKSVYSNTYRDASDENIV